MTQKDKELLLRDLSARLPYGVKCVSGVDDATLLIEGINPNCCGASEVQVTYEKSGINFDTTISAIKPYLFPFSSMTDELWDKEFRGYGITEFTRDSFKYGCEALEFNNNNSDLLNMVRFINQLIKNHFDIYGLIEKGLAIDATGLSIY